CVADEETLLIVVRIDEPAGDAVRVVTTNFASAGIEPGGEDFRGAMETCVALIEGVGFGGRGRRGLVDDTELQDAFVEFSDCIRDEGFDVGDLEFDGPRGRPGPGGEDGAPGGFGEDGPPEFGEDGPDREGGFGDRSGFIAESLGLDPDDPDVVAALELCGPVLEEATAGFRPGGPGADQD
ncbi:MAG: hypothetical protein IH940_14335, partial [Acidobacteria bacterium]|nr:hypothetical protein [Acidobacteriota bacterium]